MSNGVEIYLPYLLVAGALLSLVLLLVKVRNRFWYQKRRRKRPFNLVANSTSTPSLSDHISSNGHNHTHYPFAPGIQPHVRNLTKCFDQLKQASIAEQFRLLSALSPEQRTEFVNGLSYQQQAELWALLPLEIWAKWLTKNTPLLPYEREQMREILGFCNISFRAWAARWSELNSSEQSYLWLGLDLAQQELLWKRLAALRLILQRQKDHRQRRLTYWSRLVPTAKVRLWLTLTTDERLQLWEQHSPSYWLKLWRSLDDTNRTELWEGLNASQRRRMRHYLQQAGES